jgi:DNA-3-methyladenine glycosylase I
VRNRAKIAATIDNARTFLEVQATCGSFERFLWAFVDGRPVVNHWQSMAEVPATTALSDALSKELKRRGFRFVGSTICYAFMQAVGLVNDHLVHCHRHAPLAAAA